MPTGHRRSAAWLQFFSKKGGHRSPKRRSTIGGGLGISAAGRLERMSNRTLLLGWRTRWNRTLLRFIGRRVRAAVDIEDLAQETYLRLLRARDLHDVRSPQSYLLRVASHVVAEWRDRQPPEEMFEPVDEEFLPDERSPEFELEAEVSQTRLDQALAQIPPMTRAVLILKFRENRQCKQIAAQLDLSDRQVRRHLTRGFEQLRSALIS
jgi:RNA polymerase sigma factor (sigma-70 family)